MNKRIAIAALAALFVASSMLGTLAKPALADADDHPVKHHRHHHHHAYAMHPNGNGWYNGKYYGNNGYHYGTQPGKRWISADHDRDDRKRHHAKHQ